MSVSERDQVDGATPGLQQLGIRLLIGAVLVIVALLLLQRRGTEDRLERESFALVSGTIRISELAAPVEILRDARGIPHVMASDENEAWFGLGFAHAQDRLAQMVWLRRRAMGRTAELDGRSALPADRLARVLEIAGASAESAAALPKASRVVLEAYAAGVNARIARIRQGRAKPPRRLRESIDALESWQPADSLAVVKLLSWCIGGTLETTLVLDELIQRLDSVPARPFFPGRASIDFGVAPEIPNRPSDASTNARKPLDPPFGSTRALCDGIGLPTGGAWVLDASLSENRAPLLIADWHVAPSAPALFYEAHLAAGELDVAGATLPGSPILWAGRNRKFAWAGVPAGAPVSDLFVETLRENRGLYQNGTLWVPLEVREETLRYLDDQGNLAETTFKLRSTRHGPLIESLFRAPLPGPAAAAVPSGRSARALSWTGARVGDGLTSMLGLLRLSDSDAVASTLAEHHEPVLAIAYADHAGQGGVQVAGWLPLRPLPTGLVPVQGRLRSFDWRERVPIERLPSEVLGSGNRRWVLAADQPWPTNGGLNQMEWLWRPGDRAARLDFELDKRRKAGRFNLRTASELLQDDVAQRAPRVVASILALARRTGALPIEAAEVATLLERWDGEMGADQAGAAAYHLLIEHLLEDLLRAPFGSELFYRYLEAPHVRPQFAIERLVLRAAKIRRAGGWTDEDRVSQAARRGLRETWVSLTHRLGPTRDRWSWGRLHRIRFSPFGPSGVPTRHFNKTLGLPGSGETLAFARHRPGITFDVERAGLYRVAMDLSSPEGLLSSLAPGQSEHPGHPHYSDGIGRWVSSRLSLLATSRIVIDEESTERLLLEPAP
jgi:penicillin amidase